MRAAGTTTGIGQFSGIAEIRMPRYGERHPYCRWDASPQVQAAWWLARAPAVLEASGLSFGLCVRLGEFHG
jgi:hypothetical protein